MRPPRPRPAIAAVPEEASIAIEDAPAEEPAAENPEPKSAPPQEAEEQETAEPSPSGTIARED